MYTIESLLEKYRDQLIIVEERKEAFNVLEDLVDMKELDSHIIHPTQLNLIKQNIKYHQNYNGFKTNLHLYEIIRNVKSEFYYKELEERQDISYKPYFEEPTIFVIYEETLGLQETNSEPLHRDYIMLQGVTPKDFQERSQYLFNYLSYISAWEETL